MRIPFEAGQLTRLIQLRVHLSLPLQKDADLLQYVPIRHSANPFPCIPTEDEQPWRYLHDTVLCHSRAQARIRVKYLLAHLGFFYDIPYLNGTILSLKLVIFNNWVCFTLTEAGAILFAIVAENTVVFYVVLSIFGLILNLTCASYIKEKRLVIDIETA